MELYAIDPLKMTDNSLYDYVTFADNALLLKLREECRAAQQRKKRRRKKASREPLSFAEDERIRVLLNSGLGNSAIELQLDLPKGTINNRKYTNFNKKKIWMRDEHGQVQWKTAGQPGGERHAGSDATTESGSPLQRFYFS
jgi:hypothetical protein